MNIFDGIKNFLSLVNENWTTICVCIGLIILLAKKIKDYLNKTDDEKVELALKQINEIMLKFVTEAEIDYESFAKAGSIKRAQVINQMYQQFPILAKVADQQKVIEMIDAAIDEALPTLRQIIKENNNKEG